IPTGESVTVTLNGVTLPAPLDANDNFTVTFDTHTLAVADSPYTIRDDYAGDADFQGTSDSSTTLTANKAAPMFSDLNIPVLSDGAATTTISGKLSAGSLIPPGSVTVTLDGTPQTVPLGTDGTFSATFSTASLNVGTHIVTLHFDESTNFEGADASAVLD